MKIKSILNNLENIFKITPSQVAEILGESIDVLLRAEDSSELFQRILVLHKGLIFLSKKSSDLYQCRLALIQRCRINSIGKPESFIHALKENVYNEQTMLRLAEEAMKIQLRKEYKKLYI